ncbi:hypothetical protein ACQPZP_27400 [Spirillospora sp. CA-142024]|uniref:hypothetical protein n=1 Tax=Spirillospora sp. CA-142024 TaxID=3240036 RepID=UPI003D927B26
MNKELYGQIEGTDIKPQEVDEVEEAGKDPYSYIQLRKSGLTHKQAKRSTMKKG